MRVWPELHTPPVDTNAAVAEVLQVNASQPASPSQGAGFGHLASQGGSKQQPRKHHFNQCLQGNERWWGG